MGLFKKLKKIFKKPGKALKSAFNPKKIKNALNPKTIKDGIPGIPGGKRFGPETQKKYANVIKARQLGQVTQPIKGRY